MDTTDDITPILATPDATHAAPALPAPEPLAPKTLAACRLALGEVPPDADAEPGSIRSAWRDLSARGSGPEAYRRVLRGGAESWGWLGAERLPRTASSARDRRASVYGDVYLGDVVATFSRRIEHGRSAGKATLDDFRIYCGHDEAGKPILVECAAKKRRDGRFALVLPNGSALIVGSPDW